MFRTYIENVYVFDQFFGRPIIPKLKLEGYLLQASNFQLNQFNYTINNASFAEFGEWLNQFTQSEKFITSSSKFIDLQNKLNAEDNRKTRGKLQKELSDLEENF